MEAHKQGADALFIDAATGQNAHSQLQLCGTHEVRECAQYGPVPPVRRGYAATKKRAVLCIECKGREERAR